MSGEPALTSAPPAAAAGVGSGPRQTCPADSDGPGFLADRDSTLLTRPDSGILTQRHVVCADSWSVTGRHVDFADYSSMLSRLADSRNGTRRYADFVGCCSMLTYRADSWNVIQLHADSADSVPMLRGHTDSGGVLGTSAESQSYALTPHDDSLGVAGVTPGCRPMLTGPAGMADGGGSQSADSSAGR